MNTHTVTLPHPTANHMNTGTCTCGWTIGYSPSAMSAAVHAAHQHIVNEARTQVIDASQLDGTVRLMEGRSL